MTKKEFNQKLEELDILIKKINNFQNRKTINGKPNTYENRINDKEYNELMNEANHITKKLIHGYLKNIFK
jgi:hypothetical protein